MSEWYATLSHWLEANPEWLAWPSSWLPARNVRRWPASRIPGTVLLFALGVMVGQSGALSLGETLLLAYTGGRSGDAISYGIGRRFHPGHPPPAVLRDHPEWLAGAETLLPALRRGQPAGGPFIGPLRPMLPLVAGMLDMPFVRFVLVSMLAAAGWAVAYMPLAGRLAPPCACCRRKASECRRHGRRRHRPDVAGGDPQQPARAALGHCRRGRHQRQPAAGPAARRAHLSALMKG